MLQGSGGRLAYIVVLGLVGSVNANLKPEDVEPEIENLIEEGKIFDGETAAEGQFPYQVDLRLENEHFCGGSLISRRHVLTAAHCVARISNLASLTVVVGTNKLTAGGRTMKVDKIRVHEKWNPSKNSRNDIAVIKLTSSVELGRNVALVTLPAHEPSGSTHCTISGWGITSFPSTQPNDLQYLNVDTVSFLQCQDAYDGEPHADVFDTNICTLTKKGGGACFGDSGSPVVIKSINPGEFSQVGIVSWGKSCAVGYPDVHTKVSSYNAWIIAAMT